MSNSPTTRHPINIPLARRMGARIAFTSERGVTHDLYVMDSDGNNVIRLTHDNFFESRPSWSPDGTKIAFSSARRAVRNSEIYAMDANGENEINLTEHKMHDIVPSWSPDGKKIVFDSRRLFEGAHIYVITAEGENLERPTEEGNHGTSPVYVLDGRKIAYVSRRGGDYNIYLMDTNGRNVVKLTRTPPGIDNILPSWLPGAFAVNPNGKLPISWGVLKWTGNP